MHILQNVFVTNHYVSVATLSKRHTRLVAGRELWTVCITLDRLVIWVRGTL